MGTVLWANHLLDGAVVSDEADKRALFEHAAKLDKLAVAAGLEPLSHLIDHTDLLFNTSDDELPEGIASTDELMAREGVWATGVEALAILTGLLDAINTERPRFGILHNDIDAVVAELSESIEYAKKAQAAGASFNFSVVM